MSGEEKLVRAAKGKNRRYTSNPIPNMDSITPHCVSVSINKAVFTADSADPRNPTGPWAIPTYAYTYRQCRLLQFFFSSVRQGID